MMKLILKIRDEDLDFILKHIIELKIKEIKIKRKIKQRNTRSTSFPNTYNEPDD
ncbi:hypothetical protein [Chryseobacterium sp. MEBOG07]|uniref:hypothetical protein n=1 Tax=Chryseobacterium sp. MEBOG07 TaxID=2879939 RepID=UPI001F181206|nr:hypothetical protein [Chryseobacterium sp. MEBOG07]UKB78315.1 hypothetical protein LF886_17790 [Chryseobacterium sp. MEBOG07]